MIHFFYSFYVAEIVPTFSLDRDEVTFTGNNEELYQKDVVSIGSYKQVLKITVNGTITGLGSYCFYECISVRKIILPDSLKTVGMRAFSHCQNLVDIIIPFGVTTVLNEAFYMCVNLQNVTFSTSMTIFENGSNFHGCICLKNIFIKDNSIYTMVHDNKFLIEHGNRLVAGPGAYASIVIPKEVEIIAQFAFAAYSKLTTVTFENGSLLKTIEGRVFRYTNLKGLTVPNGTESIGNLLFEYCDSFTYIDLPSTLKYVSDTVFATANNLQRVNFVDCVGIKSSPNGGIFNQNNVLIFIPNEIKSFHIVNSTLEIPSQVIQTRPNLVNITTDENHTVYKAIKNILYYSSNMSLIACAGGIEEAEIDADCTEILSMAFMNTKVRSIKFNGSKVTTIWNSAFGSTDNLIHIQLPDSIRNIHRAALSSSNLKNQTIEIPSGVTFIGDSLFTYSKVKKVHMEKCLNITSIGISFFRLCAELEEVLLPPNIVSIDSEQFKSCTSLKTITIPGSVTQISEKAFAQSTSLCSVKIEGNSLTEIGISSFKDCNLSVIQIPDSLRVIKSEAFANNKFLQYLNFSDKSNLMEIGALAIEGCESLKSIQLGENFKTFNPTALSGANNLLEIIVIDNPNFISKDGILYTKNSSKVIACAGGVTTAVLDGNVKEFAESAFFKCSRVVSIDMSNIPLEKISESAFYGCSSLLKVQIPSTVSEVFSDAFNGCSKLKEAVFKRNSLVKVLNSGVFSGCQELAKVVFEDNCSLIEISDFVFKECKQLKIFTFPSTLNKIGKSSFEGCCSLEDIDLYGTHVEAIGNFGFRGCQKLNCVKLSSRLKSLGEDCFRGCKNLTKISYCGSNDISEPLAFVECPKVNVYVSINYIYEGIGGLKGHRFLDKDCLMPSPLFSRVEGNGIQSIEMLLITIINDCEY